MAKVDVYQAVTDKIIAELEKGNIPWRKPWKSDECAPRNLITKKPYRGINVFLLGMAPYSSPYWLSFKQVKAKGGTVKKGEKATMVVFWKPFLVDDDDNPGKKKSIPLLRYYNVFNVEQTEGFDYPKPEPNSEFNPIEKADEILGLMKNPPSFAHGGDRAYYSPLTDHVQLPQPEQFESPEAYYGTKFHEYVHSTGHESRLKRQFGVGFGNENYSKEELVAEMGAAMLCGVSGIDSEGKLVENMGAYIKNWLSKLKDDKKLLISAAGQAQKAADLVQGIEQKPYEVINKKPKASKEATKLEAVAA